MVTRVLARSVQTLTSNRERQRSRCPAVCGKANKGRGVRSSFCDSSELGCGCKIEHNATREQLGVERGAVVLPDGAVFLQSKGRGDNSRFSQRHPDRLHAN